MPWWCRARGSSYAERVAGLEACLVDAYDTIVTCDFSHQRGEISALADISARAWQAEYRQDEKPSMLDSPLPRFDLDAAQLFGLNRQFREPLFHRGRADAGLLVLGRS